MREYRRWRRIRPHPSQYDDPYKWREDFYYWLNLRPRDATPTLFRFVFLTMLGIAVTWAYWIGLNGGI